MLLSELQEKYPLVFERLAMQTHLDLSQRSLDSLDVHSTLTWSETQEGRLFWERVHRYDISEAKRLQPDLFIEVEILPYRIVTNGLFKN